MSSYDVLMERVDAWREGWPVSIRELCGILAVERFQIMRAIVALGMAPEVKKWGRVTDAMFKPRRGDAMDIAGWIFNHVEERVYITGSTSRKVGGKTGCRWIQRWNAPTDGALAPELDVALAEQRRYTGKELSALLNVSEFKVSRIGRRLGYSGGRYTKEEARRVASCFTATPSAPQ